MPLEDRRAIDTNLGTLTGEGSQQIVRQDDEHLSKVARDPWPLVPSVIDSDPTYYDRPLLKDPVWIWAVPLYFYVGGLSGAAMTLGAASQLVGGDDLREFVRRCRWLGGIGGGIGSLLLIYDLGRPSRFLNMLRVFRPTSPMSVGAWVLAAAAPAAMSAALWSHRPGFLGKYASVAGMSAGLMGMPLAGYTSVLITNSAIPLWQGSRRSMPFLFICSAITSAASMLDMMNPSRREQRLLTIFGTAGRVGELIAIQSVEAEARLERVRRPLHEGMPGALLKLATGLTLASLATSLLPGGGRMRRLSGVLGTLGALSLRFGIYYAGRASAADPRASFHQQRIQA